MSKVQNSIPMMIKLLEDLNEKKEVSIDSFHYGDDFKVIAETLYQTVKSIGRYGISYEEGNFRVLLKI